VFPPCFVEITLDDPARSFGGKISTVVHLGGLHYMHDGRHRRQRIDAVPKQALDWRLQVSKLDKQSESVGVAAAANGMDGW
jgi:hypothetical protein